jgi:hypothetical protein
VHPSKLVGAIDDEPFHALGGGIRDRFSRLYRVGEERLGRGHAQTEQEVELGGRCDFETRAFLRQHLEHAAIGVGLDRVVRPHARHSRAESPDLPAHDGGVDDQERPGVLLAGCLAHDLEVEADLGMRVEKLLLRLLLWKRALARDAAAVPHQRFLRTVSKFRECPGRTLRHASQISWCLS